MGKKKQNLNQEAAVNKNAVIAGVVIAGVALVWFGFSHKKEAVVEQPMNAVVAVGASSEGPTAEALYEEAQASKNENDLPKAKEAYQKILTDHADSNNIETVQKELESVNMDLIFSPTLSDDTVVHEVKSGETLGILAKKYGTTVELIKVKNNLKNDTIRVNQKLYVWTVPFNIYVDKSQNVLFLKKGDEVVKIYNVSTGANNGTPVGEFKIISRLVDPVWFNRGIVVPPESPENVLGTRWLGFDVPGYGIHGTIEPETIGQQVTAGCVRMRNAEVEELFTLIPLGTKVVIVD